MQVGYVKDITALAPDQRTTPSTHASAFTCICHNTEEEATSPGMHGLERANTNGLAGLGYVDLHEGIQ